VAGIGPSLPAPECEQAEETGGRKVRRDRQKRNAAPSERITPRLEASEIWAIISIEPGHHVQAIPQVEDPSKDVEREEQASADQQILASFLGLNRKCEGCAEPQLSWQVMHVDLLTVPSDSERWPKATTDRRSGQIDLWDHPAVELLLEGGLYALGIYLYLRATRARDKIGSWGLYLLLAFLLATWLSAAFGPPPPNERTLAWSALTMWLLVAWAYWVDRHREPGKS
jgi:hypothetical protein